MTKHRTAGILTAAVLYASSIGSAQNGHEGHVNYLAYALSFMDPWTSTYSASMQQWFQGHFSSMVGFSPYADSRTWWWPQTSVYHDLYGITPGSWAATTHPEWILKDQWGNWLYIPWNCSGTCPLFAGDVANPAFRSYVLGDMWNTVNNGNYAGLFVDDSNMEFRVGDGWGNQIPPIDTNTGQVMSWTAWRSYIATFEQQIRSTFPNKMLMENAIWFSTGGTGVLGQDPYIQAQLRTANVINLERGIASDGGLTGGTGFWSVYNFFNFVDIIHATGAGVNFEEYQLSPAGQEYGLASWLLISNGKDSLGDGTATPSNWFSGYSLDLGSALGPRTYSNGIYQRNFTGGMVVLAEPGLPGQTIWLPQWFQRIDGSWVNSVYLQGSQGAVLIGANSAAPPPPAPGANWSSLGGQLTSKAAVARNADGRLEVFARGGDNGLWHNSQASAGGTWSGWSSLGGSIAGNPVVGTNADGRLEVLARGGDNALWHIWQTYAGGGWSGWAGLGGSFQGDPSVALTQDGRLEAFAIGGDNGLWHLWQNAPNGNWSGWAGLGGALAGQIGLVKNSDGRLEVFGRGADNGVWHIWQSWASGPWSGWASLGGVIRSNPAVAVNADGRLQVFAVGIDGAVWDIYQNSAGGSWSGWGSLGGIVTPDPSVAINADGRLELFVRGTDNAVWHNWQTSAGGGWSGWASLGGIVVNGPSTGKNADGRLQVFDIGGDDAVWSVAQTSAGKWN